MKIGFFDSGLGGLTIMRAVAQSLPEYSYEYYGDTAHLPYGDRTEAEVLKLTKQGIEHLFARDCGLVVIACNTASAETLRALQDDFLPKSHPDRKILGVIIPTVETLIESKLDTLVMIATRRTVESRKYEKELAKYGRVTNFSAHATPGLVPLIEAGKWQEAFLSVVPILEKIDYSSPAGVVLGCTHYTLLKHMIREYCNENVVVFSQDEIIPNKLKQYLNHHIEIDSRLHKAEDSIRNIFLTAPSDHYDVVIEHMLTGAIET